MKRCWLFVLIAVAAPGGVVRAATIPFTEDFTSNVASWGDASGIALLTHVPFGGPDGGAYASQSFSTSGLGGKSPVVFRAQDEFNSSGHAFEGNWISENVDKVTAFVRHNAPQPLNFSGRFALPGNTPAATYVQFAPVQPNTWTQLTFSITPGNPAFVTFEGQDFQTVFSNIGHVQFGVSIPAALNTAATPLTLDIDKVTVVPEPAGVAIAAVGGLICLALRSPRSCRGVAR